MFCGEVEALFELEEAAAFVGVEGVDADFFFGADAVVGGEDGGGGADVVHEGDGHEGAGGDARGEVEGVEV